MYYSHRQISAHIPSFSPFLDHRLFNAPHLLYTCATLPLSLLIYNDGAILFINLWYHTYPPYKTNIYCNLTFPIYLLLIQQSSYIFWRLTLFLDTLWPPLSRGYYTNHHFSARHPTTSQRHTLQHILHFNYTSHMYANKTFQNSLPKNNIPISVQSYVNIASLYQVYCIQISFTLSISRFTPHVKTVSFTAHSSIHTKSLARFFTFLFQKD